MVIKVCIVERNNLNEDLFKEDKEIELIDDPEKADWLICQSTIRFPSLLHKTIYIAVEPPLADHRLWCYSQFDKFPLVVRHNPDPNKPNQIPFTDSDEAQYYPTYPNPSSIPQYTRQDTKIKNRGIFYAGMVGPYEMQPDAYGGINLTKLRRQLGDYINKHFPSSKVIGIGWNYQTTKVSDWRLDKSNQIKDSDCDFVLALENTALPNYLYEKIWDGFAADRVTLYLGDTRIEHHIPLDCFIDLRPYFNTFTKEFDFLEFRRKINTLTQEEYDNILTNARRFRETAKGKHKELMNKLTIKIINFVKNNLPQSL